MPSVEYPSYYERSRADAAQTYEQVTFFKSIESETWTGDVESPLGHVALVEVTLFDLIDYLPSESTLGDLSRLGIEPGWYIVKTDNNGLCWGLYYGQGTYGEEQARADYAEAEAVSLAWDNADDGEA